MLCSTGNDATSFPKLLYCHHLSISHHKSLWHPFEKIRRVYTITQHKRAVISQPFFTKHTRRGLRWVTINSSSYFLHFGSAPVSGGCDAQCIENLFHFSISSTLIACMSCVSQSLLLTPTADHIDKRDQSVGQTTINNSPRCFQHTGVHLSPSEQHDNQLAAICCNILDIKSVFSYVKVMWMNVN